ncbi:MAG: hypothetical protein J0M34_08075 [Alphaproteobacteria bacterium]|nr:hypothetical protein [Alphaproteobacteria bacterium]
MTNRPGDLPSYRYGSPSEPTRDEKGYDVAVNRDGANYGVLGGTGDFSPEIDVRDYGDFVLNLSAIDKRLVRTSKPIIPWLGVRNTLLDNMTINNQPEAPIEVKWTMLLNYVAQHLPQGVVMPAQSELHGKQPVGGLAELLITGLGLQGYNGALNNALIEAEGFTFADEAERDLLGREAGSSRELLIDDPELGSAHERKQWVAAHVDPQAPIAQGENPYGAVGRLAREARAAHPNGQGKV